MPQTNPPTIGTQDEGCHDRHRGPRPSYVAYVLLFLLSAVAQSGFAQTCDLEITSQTGYPGSVNATDMEFTFRNNGPDACTNTEVRMPVNFPGTTMTTFAATAYDVTNVNFVGVGSSAGNGFCSWSPGIDQLTCSGVNIPLQGTFRIQLNGNPIPNPTQEGCISAYWHPGPSGTDPSSGNNPHQSCYPIGQQTVIVEKEWVGGSIAGQPVVYRARVINNSNVALNVPFTDSPPSGFIYQGVSGAAGVTCTQGSLGGTVTCNRTGGWPPGTTTFELTFLPPASAVGQWVTNTCTINPGGGWIVDDAGCQATMRLGGPPSSTKTGPIGNVQVGSTFTWTLAVTHEPSNQTGTFTVEDQVPAGFTILTAVNTHNGSPCGVSGQTVTCNIEFSSPPTVVIEIQVQATQAGTFTNTCTVDGIQPASCSHTVVVVEEDEADIEVTKTAQQKIYWPGQPINYTITVTNHGPDYAPGVEVGDSLPFLSPNWTINAPGSSMCDPITPTTSYVRCRYAGIGVGETRLITLTGIVPPGIGGGTILNRCQAGPIPPFNWIDPDESNNSYEHCQVETPRGTPNLSVAKTGPGTAPLGGEFNYVLTVQNGTPVSSSNVQIVDTLPPGVSYVSVSAEAPLACAHNIGVVTCSAASLPPNSVLQVTIRVRAEQPGSVVNTCTGSTGAGTIDTAQCSTTTVVEGGTVVVSKSDSADPVWIDQPFEYLIRVQNTSGARADNVVVNDTLPASLVFQSVGSPAPFSCTQSAGVVQCSAGQVPAGADVTIPVTVRGTQDGVVTNVCTATVGGNPVVGVCEEPTTVRNGLLAIQKTDSADPVLIGQAFDYTLSVHNPTPGPANSVTVTDTLPHEVTFVNVAAPSPFNCSAQPDGTTHRIVCSAASVPAGYNGDITITVRASRIGTASNFCTALVSPHQVPQPDCNETTEVDPVVFDVVKSDSIDPVRVGQEFSYYLDWTYGGTFTLPRAILDDALPEDVSFVDVHSDHASVLCVPTVGGIVEEVACLFTDVPAGASGRIEIVVRAPDSAMSVENVCSLAVMSQSNYGVTDCHEATTVIPDVMVEKTDHLDPVLINQPITYYISVINRHHTIAERIEVVDVVPADVTLVSATGTNGWLCDTSDPAAAICSGDVPGNTTVTLTLVMTAPSTAQVVTNVCTATAGVKVASFAPDPGRANYSPVDLPSDLCDEDTTVEAPQADVSAEKLGPSTPVLTGQLFSYILRVTNHGPDPAVNVLVTDSLPAGTVFSGVSGPGWTCGHDGGAPGTVSCSMPSLPVGQAQDITLQVIAPSTPGLVENVCQLSSDTPDPVVNPACQVTTVVREAAPLVAVKVDAVDPVIVSGAILYTITVTNTDPEYSANNVEIQDTLPAGTELVSASGQDWVCGAQSADVVLCELGTLAAGAVSSFNVEVIAPSVAGTVTNTCAASVASDPLWPVDNTGCTETTAVRAPEPLRIEKVDVVDPVRTGQTVTYQIAVTNPDATEDAENVAVNDALPAGTVFQTAASSQGSCAHDGDTPGVVSCTLGTVSANASATVTIEVAAPDQAGTIVNTCSASATYVGGVDDSQCTEDTTVAASGQLVAVKEDLVDPVRAGQTLPYRIAVTNTDTSEAASDLLVVDPLPAGTVFQSAVVTGGSCSHNGGSPGEVSCSIASLAAGASATIDVVVTAPATAGTITNTCSLTSTFVGTVDASGCVEDTLVELSGSLVATKTDLVDPVTTGQPVTYRITVANSDASEDATDLEVIDDLPAGTVFQSATSPAGVCTHDSGVPGSVSCSIASLAAGASATIDVVVVAPTTAGTITNTCSLTGTFIGSIDDSGCAEDTQVVQAGTLVVTKSDLVDPIQTGQSISYVINVSNGDDNETASNVVVTDPLPAGTVFQSATSASGACLHDSGSPGSVSCTLGSIAPLTNARIDIVVQAPSVPGSVTNTCSAVATFAGSVDHTQCHEDTAIVDTGSLVVTKVDLADPVQVGESITYQINVANTDTSADANDVVVLDPLPAGTVFESVNAAGASCVHDGGAPGAVTCTFGSIAALATGTITLSVRAPDTAGTVTNTCSATATFAGTVDDTGCTEDTTITAGGLPQLEYTKTASPPTVSLGGTVTWTIAVTNTGTAAATDVVVVDDVPASLTVDHASASQGSCLVLDQRVECQLGTLDRGESASVTISTVANTLGTTENLCVVSTSSLTDPTTSRCGGTVVIGEEPLLQVRKSTSQAQVFIGGRFEWTISVSNIGTGAARNVVITDSMPEGVEVLGAPAECEWLTPDFVCQVGDLAPGASHSLVFMVRGTQPGQHRNVCVASYVDISGNPVDVVDGCESTTVVTGGDNKPVPVNDPKALLLMILLMMGIGMLVTHRR